VHVCARRNPLQEKDIFMIPEINQTDKKAAFPESHIDNEVNHSTNQATEVVSFATQRYDFFHDKNGQVYAMDKQTRETSNIDGRKFRDLLTAKFYVYTHKSVREQSMREAITTLSGIGRYQCALCDVFTRVAHCEGAYYLDLCQAANSLAIKITADGWKIIDKPPVCFIRSETMQALPLPKLDAGTNLNILWEVCNIPPDSQLLATAFIAEMLRPDTPYPVLELLGEHGSAKSTTQTAIRRCIDPNTCDLRAAPKSTEDLFVAARSNHIISCENVSYLSAPLQDALCIASTGGAYAKRKLYTDTDESVIYAKNPVIINGISASITAQDLIDRTITVELPVITDRTEYTKVFAIFNNHHSEILGALLNIMARALKLLPSIQLPPDERPRLVEFAYFGMAISLAMGFPQMQFMEQFNKSRQEAIARTIDASPIATALIAWFEKIRCTSTELPAHELFKRVEPYRQSTTDAWPKSAKGFGDALRRAAPALRQLGIECRCLGKHGSHVIWQISSIENKVEKSRESLHVVTHQDLKTSQTLFQSKDIPVDYIEI